MANPIIDIVKKSPPLRRLSSGLAIYYSLLVVALIYLIIDFIIESVNSDD